MRRREGYFGQGDDGAILSELHELISILTLVSYFEVWRRKGYFSQANDLAILSEFIGEGAFCNEMMCRQWRGNLRVVRSSTMEGGCIGISLGDAGMFCLFGGRLNYAVSWQGGYMHVIGGILFWPSLVNFPRGSCLY